MPPLSTLPSAVPVQPPHYDYVWNAEAGQFDILEEGLPLGVHIETEIVALVIVKRLNDWRRALANAANIAAVIPLSGLHYPLIQRVPHDPPPDTNPVDVRL